MLTKELLKFSIRSGRIRPAFVPEEGDILERARGLIDLFRQAEGQSLGELEELLDETCGTGDVEAGLRKLLLDRCGAEEDDGSVMERRWQALAAAQALRLGEPGLDEASFRGRLAATLGRGFVELKEDLYADLPACRRIKGFRELSAVSLLQRYNCAQVQGLLLRARSVHVRLAQASLAERRELFRQLKFHRLIAEVTRDEGEGRALVVELGGPLSLFDSAATYGMRLANFFPHVLNLPRWEVEAEVHIKNKTVTLKLDQKSGLKSHYRHQTPFVPDELLAFVEAFNTRQAGVWQASPGTEFVHLGRESYCFPDITIRDQKKRKIHIELFHRWHAGTLRGRIQTLEKIGFSELRLGVSKNLAKTAELKMLLEESAWFARFGFIFSEFPTPKLIFGVLDRE